MSMIDPKKKVVKILKKQALKTDPTGVIGNEILDHTDQLDSMHEKLDAIKETNQQDKQSAAESRKYSATLELPEGVNVVTMKGEKGDKPEYKKDYLTEEELAQIKQEITPIRGQHYFTQQEIAQFVNAATPVKGVHYQDGKDGRNGVDGKNGIGIQGLQGLPGLDGKDGKDGVNPDPKEVIKELRLLKGNDRLDISNIRNAEQLLHGGGIVTIQNSGTQVTNKATVLNFTGSGINSVTESLGIVTIDVSGGGSSLTLETNGILNGDQTLLNLIAGTNVTLSDDGLGGVTFSASPTSPSNSVQFNNSGSFGGSSNLLWDGTNLSVLGITNTQDQNLTISVLTPSIVDTSGNSLNLTGGAGNGAGSGGGLNLTGGTGGSTSGNGGGVFLTGGTAIGDGSGGVVGMVAGSPHNADGGEVLVLATDGQGVDKNGGNFTIRVGSGTGVGTTGQFKIINGATGATGIQNFDLLTTVDRTYQWPDASGIIALTSQLPTFKTNGNPNGSQVILNLKAGTNITLTDDGVGGITIDASGGGGSGITIGTTTIASGTNTRILYNNSGVVGEYVISGSGNVAMTTSPAFTTPNIGSATGSISGNAGTATALQTARTIAGVSFDATANIAIPASGLSNGVTGSGAVVLATSPTLATAVLGSSTATTQTPGDNSTKLATTAYVDAAVLGQNFKEAVKVATTAALVGVYLNGSSGVGATFTYTATGTDVIDGVTLALGDRVLVKNQGASDLQNGIYTVTTAGALGVAGILTRATDSNQSFEFKTGDSVFVTAGTTQTSTTWAYTGIDSPTMGTTSLTYVQVAGQGSFTAGNGITITGVSIAIDTSVTVDKNTSQTLTNKTLTSPVLTTPTLGVATATSLAIGGATIGSNGLAVTGHLLIEGVTSTGATGTGKFVFDGSPTLVTPVLGVASATTINRVTLTTPATGSTLTILDGKTLTVNKILTLDGTDSTTMTFPTTSATIARTDAAQTFTGTQTFSQVITSNNAITASGNAATVPITSKINTVTNNSAATLTITMATASAVDRQQAVVCILDASGVAQTITWVNTENSTVTAPTTSNGSTTLPLTVALMYNAATSLWRCVAKA